LGARGHQKTTGMMMRSHRDVAAGAIRRANPGPPWGRRPGRFASGATSAAGAGATGEEEGKEKEEKEQEEAVAVMGWMRERFALGMESVTSGVDSVTSGVESVTRSLSDTVEAIAIPWPPTLGGGRDTDDDDEEAPKKDEIDENYGEGDGRDIGDSANNIVGGVGTTIITSTTTDSTDDSDDDANDDDNDDDANDDDNDDDNDDNIIPFHLRPPQSQWQPQQGPGGGSRGAVLRPAAQRQFMEDLSTKFPTQMAETRWGCTRWNAVAPELESA
jgi:hypothetical protein